MGHLKISRDREVTPGEALAIQKKLAGRVLVENYLPRKIRSVKGIDVGFSKSGDDQIYAGVVVLDFQTLECLEPQKASGGSPNRP